MNVEKDKKEILDNSVKQDIMYKRDKPDRPDRLNKQDKPDKPKNLQPEIPMIAIKRQRQPRIENKKEETETEISP